MYKMVCTGETKRWITYVLFLFDMVHNSCLRLDTEIDQSNSPVWQINTESSDRQCSRTECKHAS